MPILCEITIDDFGKRGDRVAVRAYHVLTNIGDYITRQQVRDASDSELLELPNFGKRCLAAVRKAYGGHPQSWEDKFYRMQHDYIELKNKYEQLKADLEL
jgi:hypothetical protein